MADLAINGGAREAGSFRTPNWPTLTDADRKAVMDALDTREWGRLYPQSRAQMFESAFAEYQQARHGIAVSNGTVSIELSLIAAGIRPGDEVLVPAVTFIASASAIVRVGAVPIFVDSDPETIAMSPAAAEAAITPRTRGIVAVHYGGYPVDLDALVPLAQKHKLVLVEDCAHAQGSEWRRRRVGAFGHFGSFSFQQSKSLPSGEGGIVITNDDGLAEAARLYHNIGRVPGRPGYQHLALASNYRLPELSAALLLSQLDRLQEGVERRMVGWRHLSAGFRQVGGLLPLKADERITQRGFYFMVLRYDRRQFADAPLASFIKALNAEGVPCYSGYGMPLYRQQAFRREHVAELLGKLPSAVPDYPNLRLPVAERFCSEEQVTIPHPVLLADAKDLDYIIAAVAKLKTNAVELHSVQV